MMIRHVVLLLVAGIAASSNLANAASDPCSGPLALLNLVNRPTASDSACTTPYKKILLESGFQYQELYNGLGTQQNLPSAELRIGLPAHSEFFVISSNYIHQSLPPTQGATATYLGLKHQLGFNEKWIVAVDGYLGLPSGSPAFGSAGTGFIINEIITYSFNSKWSVVAQFGASSLTEPSLIGGGQYSSFNPDFVLSYAPTSHTSIYGEIYGQSKIGPELGWGWNSDAGLLYLVNSAMTVDVEVGQRVYGQLGGFERYVGAGFAVILG